MDRDDDQTLIDIRFNHDVLDPSVHPESFSSDLVDHDEVHRISVSAAMILGFVVTTTFMYAVYGLLSLPK